ncbi:MarR family transcriptional regulator [Streptomyces sp. NPDC008092]|uniref:MarR family transcriptional regulator n=1 Tax=Streptomyces sp. NPDC008092 TaxID=3364808 RepID=UPI0036E63438
MFERLGERGHPTVGTAHAVVFMNLDPSGTRTVTLAQRAGITRQAMSQLVGDLQASDMSTFSLAAGTTDAPPACR